MPRLHLTDLSIRALKPTEQYTTYWDTKLSGFGVRVGLRSKTFIVMRGNDRRRVKVGSYPDIPLAEARKEAQRLLSSRDVQPSTATLKEVIELFFKVRCTPQNNKPSTIREYRRIFNRHLTPLFERKLADITHARINRVFDDLSATPIEANHAYVAFRMLFRFARQRRLIDSDPLEGMSLPYSPRSRDRVLTDGELRQVWEAAQAFPFPFGSIVSLLILMGQRLGETSGLKWSCIDEREMTITLPAEITKNSTQHTFPYGQMVQSIFDKTPRISEFLFPSRDGTAAYVGYINAKGRFDKICPLPHWTLHDLRRTFSTIHARIGTAPHVTEALLNHKTGTRSPIQRIYDRHTYLPEMRAALERYDDYLGSLGIRA
jgi:integrase